MKIRHQFKLLIAGIIILPLACVISLPVYHYLSSPQRYLLKGYKEIRKIGDLQVTEDDWQALRGHLKNIPPNVQVLVCYAENQRLRVLISNMPDFKASRSVSPLELWEFIHATGNDYDYQVQAPAMVQDESAGAIARRPQSTFLVISRMRVTKSVRHRPRNRFYLPAFIILLVFEIFCVALVIAMSRTIFRSITMLEESTKKIADGALDTKLPHPRRHQLNEITSLVESLEKMRASLKDDEERRTKFIMGISHDLRTPVALIKGYTEAIADGVVNDMDSVRNSLSIIHSKADQLESMINDLINYVKLNNTEWLRTLEPVAIAPILRAFADMAESTADIYRRDITTDIAVGDDRQVPMDRNLFSRALENLLSNAIRYSADGDSIRIAAHEDGGDIRVVIADTGSGIAPKDLEHIYDLFYRGTNSRREQGMGIGLSVVKTIIDTHGWDIHVESEQEKGTAFTITIPLAASGAGRTA